MLRFFSAILLFCFGVLSLQAAPMRLCLLEGQAPSAAKTAHVPAELTDCCTGCDAGVTALLQSMPTEDCCLDFESLPETTAPIAKELRAAPALIFCFIETLLIAPEALAIRDIHPACVPLSPPGTAAERLAVLSIWTI